VQLQAISLLFFLLLEGQKRGGFFLFELISYIQCTGKTPQTQEKLSIILHEHPLPFKWIGQQINLFR